MVGRVVLPHGLVSRTFGKVERGVVGVELEGVVGHGERRVGAVVLDERVSQQLAVLGVGAHDAPVMGIIVEPRTQHVDRPAVLSGTVVAYGLLDDEFGLFRIYRACLAHVIVVSVVAAQQVGHADGVLQAFEIRGIDGQQAHALVVSAKRSSLVYEALDVEHGYLLVSRHVRGAHGYVHAVAQHGVEHGEGGRGVALTVEYVGLLDEVFGVFHRIAEREHVHAVESGKGVVVLLHLEIAGVLLAERGVAYLRVVAAARGGLKVRQGLGIKSV